MRLNTKEDILMFLTEAGRVDLLESIPVGSEPGPELMNEFIKSRKKVIGFLKDFRKSQLAKQQWRFSKYKMLKGMNSFHTSTKGKKFHRQLGRFLATRIPLASATLLSVKGLRDSSLQEMGEVFKALSSFKTHAWIQLDQFMPLSESAEYEVFLEEAIERCSRIESELMKAEPELRLDDLDFLLASTQESCLLDNFCDATGLSPVQASEKFSKILESNKNSDFPYVISLAALYQNV